MRILVTGGTGFIGQHLVTQLLDEPHTAVTLLLRESYGSKQPLPPSLARRRPQFEVVYADLRNPRLTNRAVQQAKATAVVHLAASGATNPFISIPTALRHNLHGTLHLVEACFNPANIIQPEKVILARTPGELSGMNVYSASKAASWNFAQMLARTRHWPIYGGMIFQAYGPHQPPSTLIPSAINAAHKGEDFPMTAGKQAKDWVYVTDIVRGLIAMLKATLEPGESVDLGTGQATAVATVVEHIYQLTRSRGQPRPGLLPSRPGEVPQQIACSAKTSQRIGWQAMTPLMVGLQQTINASPPEETPV